MRRPISARMIRAWRHILIAVVLTVAPAFAAAQDVLPDPATIAVPDVSVEGNSKALKDGRKFFYFYSPDVTFAEAYADIAECRSFLTKPAPVPLPAFRPWNETVRQGAEPVYRPYPLAGAIFSALILPGLERGREYSMMRLCMEPRGYARYPIPEAVWKSLNSGDAGEIVAKQAKLASGPAPSAPRVVE
jgi:hypothetical protein